MHEYSIVQALMERIEEQARAHRAVSVSRVSVRIGEMSGVEPDLLKTAFDLVREKTVCDAATLHITRVAAQWVCRQCGRHVPAGGALRCADCGAPARMSQGDEIVLEQLELEVADV